MFISEMSISIPVSLSISYTFLTDTIGIGLYNLFVYSLFMYTLLCFTVKFWHKKMHT